MNDTLQGGDLEPVVDEQAEAEYSEDQGFDNLDDAADALEDDMPADEQPIDDQPAEEDPEAAAEDAESDTGDALVELPDGETLSLSEIADLKANGLRAADYTHKTTEVAELRKETEAVKGQYSERLQFAETALRNVAGFVESLVPPEPPFALAQSDPAAFTQQMALRNEAMGELQKLFDIQKDVDGHKTETSGKDAEAYRTEQAASLVKAMPHLSDPVKRAAFDREVAATAQEFGFSADEIAATADSRILQMVHYARIGKRSEQNRNNAKRRVQTPMKGKARPSATTPKANPKAMQRLSKSGSIHDAMEIDFD